MSGVGTVVFYGAVMCFFAACVILIRKGTSPTARGVLCCVQTACAALAIFIVVPDPPSTDVGRFARSVQQRLDSRMTQKMEAYLANAR